jgi:tetratricopeptide (TPR) repeat protein
LKAGTYGLFLIVEKEGPSTWIFSKNSGSWGSYFYDPKEDALRTPTTLVDAEYTEYLTYGFDTRELATATAYLQWENKRVPFKIDVPNVNDLYLGTIRNELRNFEGFDYKNVQAAVNFCVQNKINLEEALTWADYAISSPIGVEDFGSLRTKATVLSALNRETEAEAVMLKAMNHSTADVNSIHQYGRTLLQSGKKEKALEVFKLNRQRHPEDKFTTFVGLARGYTALNDNKNAIKNWEMAIKNLPENQKQNLAFYEGELKKLKG